MSDSSGAATPSPASAPMGGSMTDLVSTQKGGVQNLATIGAAIGNVFAPATASSSPLATPVNNLGTTGTAVLGSSTTRYSVLFHNPSTSVSAYIYPSLAPPAPTLSAPGGATLIFPGGTLSFTPPQWPNINAAFSAFAGTGTNNPLTIWEFF